MAWLIARNTLNTQWKFYKDINMAIPEQFVICISNVFIKQMFFSKIGDQHNGHKHLYDHATLLAAGSVIVEKFDNENNIVFHKKFTAPSAIFIDKDITHRITAAENNSIAYCIHALRDENSTIVDPSMIIEPLDSITNPKIIKKVEDLLGFKLQDFITK